MFIELDVDVNGNVNLSRHFKAKEFMCPHCHYVKVSSLLLEKIEKLRAEFGNKPIRITSGYRCPEYNKRIGGYYKSAHTMGLAGDLRPWYKKSFNYFDFVGLAVKIFPRVGVYREGFVHVDIYDENGTLYWYRDEKGYYKYTHDLNVLLARAGIIEDLIHPKKEVSNA